MFEIKLSQRNDLIDDKSVKWYTLIECEYCSDMQPPVYVYLPAAFLRMRGVLSPKIDLGDKRQYELNFHQFKRNEKNIDKLFSGEKCPTYKEMLKFCRHLHRKITNNKDYYGNPLDQSEQQFTEEFKKFFKENDLKLDFKKHNTVLKDVFKVFILFKSSKIEKVDYPLDYNKEFLHDDADVFQLENMLSFSKDTGSAASLDGHYSSQYGFYIEKLYALIWINLILGEDDIQYILEYITLFESAEKAFPDRYIDFFKFHFAFRKNEKVNFSEEYLVYVDSCVYQIMNERMEAIKIEKKIKTEPEKKISFAIYYILKIYINNKMKTSSWKKDENKSTTFNNILLSKETREEIYKITEDKEIENLNEFIKLLSSINYHNAFNEKEQNIIINTIFPNDKRSKKEKINQLKNNLEKIYILLKDFGLKALSVNQELDHNYVYQIIIAAYIFFQIKKLKINSLKYTESGHTKARKRPVRNNTIDGYLNHMVKNEINKEYFNNNSFNIGYLEVSTLVFAKYGYLFKPQSDVSVKLVEQITEHININIGKLWNDARELNKRFLSNSY